MEFAITDHALFYSQNVLQTLGNGVPHLVAIKPRYIPSTHLLLELC